MLFRSETGLRRVEAKIAERDGQLEAKIAEQNAEAAKRAGQLEAKIAERDGQLEAKIAEQNAEATKRDKDNLRWQVGLWIAVVVVLGVLIRWPG